MLRKSLNYLIKYMEPSGLLMNTVYIFTQSCGHGETIRRRRMGQLQEILLESNTDNISILVNNERFKKYTNFI